MKRILSPWLVFLGFFALYLWSLPPELMPYRDAGEFCLSAHTLGISHPPSYPLYVLLGHAADLLTPGNHAYGLNLLSAAAGAAAAAVVYLALAARCGAWPAAAGALLLGLNSTFWTVSGVVEMYSLTLLLASVLLLLSFRLEAGFRARLWFGAAFLYGLFLGCRTDILLWLPGLVILSFPQKGKLRWGLTLLFFGLGLSIYLYLPIRSSQGPWLDWNHPASFSNLIGSLTRRGYGGTLDLLSKSYALGSMFLPNLRVYGLHLWHNLSVPGLLLAVVGAASLSRRALFGTGLLYAASGPVFLYLANMPPNPHAMAIVEPHYLLSDMVLCVWAAHGVSALAGRWRWTAPALAALVAATAWLGGRFSEMRRRDCFIGTDFTRNLLRSVPPGSILVAKKDVQLFSLWHHQRVEGRRPDVATVAQGLAHSAWVHASEARFGGALRLGPLRSREDFERFARENPDSRVYLSMDSEIPAGLGLGPPSGLALPMSTGTRAGTSAWELFVRRGDYRYQERPEFFTSDLVADHAVARQRLGSRLLEERRLAEARECLLSAWSMKWLFPEAAMFLGYVELADGERDSSLRVYELADALFERTLALTREYHSLPDLAASVRASMVDTRLNYGVVCERMGDREGAERAYRRALEADPQSAKAHYNMAVLYWGRDWDRVAAELEHALRIDPAYPEAAKFLAAARQKAGRK